MSVQKHGTKWRADWRDEFGVRRRRDFKLKADCENFERERRSAAAEARKALGGDLPECNPSLTFEEYAQRWLARREAHDIDAATVRRQGADVRLYLVPAFGKRKIRDIARGRVKAFVEGLKAEKRLKVSTVRQITTTLSSVMAGAVEDRLLSVNPVHGVWKELSKGAKKKHSEVEVKALDLGQAAAVLESARVHEPRHYPYLATLLLAGLRPSEGLAVTADRIDFTRRTLRVDRQLALHDGGVKSTKTGKARFVDLSKPLVAILRDAATSKTATTKVVSISGEPPSSEQTPNAPWLSYADVLGADPKDRQADLAYRSASRALARCLKRAGVAAGHGLHALRHTYATGLISAGVSPVYVQQQLGHASVDLTVKVYGSHFPAKVAGAVDALADALTKPRGHQMDTSGVREASEAS